MKNYPFACLLRLVFLLAIILFPGGFLAAQSAGDEAGRITAVSVSGLKRTRPSTAEKPLRKFIGAEAALVDLDEVRAIILATGILEPLSVEIRDGEDGGGKVLAAEVREKWAIFPIPVVMVSSGEIIAGGAFFDANALGLNDKLFLAGIYSSGGWMASAGYIHASPRAGVPGWNGVASFARQERHDRDQRNEDLRSFELDSISASAGFNFSLLENSDLLSASVSLSFNEKILKNSEEAVNGPDSGLRYLGFGGGLSLGKSSWDGYLLSQEAASLRYTYRAALSGSPFHSLQFRLTWEKSLIPGFRLNLRSGIIFEPGVPVLFESSPSAAQVAILPGSFMAQHYAGGSLGLEKYLFKISAGTLSLAAAYQLVYSRGSILGDSLDHGVVGVLSFYLSKLAIPALGLGIAYNVKEDYLQGSFSLGMSF